MDRVGDAFEHSRIDLAQILRRWRRGRALAVCWGTAAALGLAILLLQGLAGQEINPYLWLLPPLVGLTMAGIVLWQRRKPGDEIRDLIREFERDQPELRHLLSAAAEQKPSAAFGAFSYLQLRVIEEVLAHPAQDEWRRQLRKKLALTRTAQAGMA